MISETLINIDTLNSTLLLLKELTLDNSSTVEPKLKLMSETFYPLEKSLKVLPSVTSNTDPVTEELSLKLLELIVLLLDTPKMVKEPESDYPLEKENLSPNLPDVPSESALEEEELINLS